MRQITSVAKLTVPTIGNCATDQITAIASSTQRVSTRLTMKPTTIAEIENRKKNEEPRKPNCSGESFSSSMIGAPARPTTILSAKFTSMNRNSRKVIFQAPFGVGCAVMAAFPVYLCRLCKIGRFQCYKGGHGQGNQDFSASARFATAGCCDRRTPQPDHDHVAGANEAVIRGVRPDMLHAITSGDFHGQIGPSSRMTNGNPNVLHVAGLTKSYRTAGEEVAVLRGVNLTVAAGESVALTGESGSGKSTLLHLIAGLDAADGGEIRLADAPVSQLSDAGRAELRRDRLGLVFQQFNLIPSLTVEDNLVFQSRIAGRHDAAWHRELVERLGLGNFLKRYPEQLSGGQQQRVAIGRALAVKPLLLLADEPTGNLDEDTADEVLALARDLVTRSGCGFLMVTHSARLAATLDRQVNLHAGVIA